MPWRRAEEQKSQSDGRNEREATDGRGDGCEGRGGWNVDGDDGLLDVRELLLSSLMFRASDGSATDDNDDGKKARGWGWGK